MTKLWLVALAACNTLKSSETLSESIRAYNDGVRWERFAVAAFHVPVARRTEFVDQADERAKDVKITDYEVVSVDRRSDNEAAVHVKLSWYRSSEGTLHETQEMQTWERHGKQWVIVDETRLRGVEMPGLPESLTTKE